VEAFLPHSLVVVACQTLGACLIQGACLAVGASQMQGVVVACLIQGACQDVLLVLLSVVVACHIAEELPGWAVLRDTSC